MRSQAQESQWRKKNLLLLFFHFLGRGAFSVLFCVLLIQMMRNRKKNSVKIGRFVGNSFFLFLFSLFCLLLRLLGGLLGSLLGGLPGDTALNGVL